MLKHLKKEKNKQTNKRKRKKKAKKKKKRNADGTRTQDEKIEKDWDDSPETFCEAEASNRLTLRLEISALPCYPDNWS